MIEVKVQKLKLLIIFLFSPLFLKLTYLQLIKGDFFYKKALRQQQDYLIVNGHRGKIFDRRGRILALDRNVYSVFINPREIKNKEEVVKKISRILNLDFKETMRRIKKDAYFVWIKRGLEEGPELEALKALDIKGLGIKVERLRIYPHNELASQVLGAVDIDNNGIAGLELYYNNVLKGRPGYMLTLEDGRNLSLQEFCSSYEPPKNGKNLVLTIDEVLQYYGEEEAKRLYQKYNARRVSIVIMEPYSGDILALANYPTFNPNKITPSDIKNMKNFAISDNFEPGSVFKVITAAALLEQGLVSLKEKVYCENGLYKIGRRLLHDYHKYGWLDFKSVIVNSSNIGVAKFVGRLDNDKFYHYLKLFGIGDETGIDLPGESPGFLRNPEEWSDYSKVSIAIGQEIAVTTLQLAKVMSIIANGGYLVRPHIVKEIRDENGARIKKISGRRTERVLSKEAVQNLKNILREVVENGTGRYAKSKVYSAGGKTGTAQKVELKNGRYSKSKYVATFAGFLPIDSPRMVIVVTVDEPQPLHFGGIVSAPAFKKIAEKALLYLRISKKERKVQYETESSFIWN